MAGTGCCPVLLPERSGATWRSLLLSGWPIRVKVLVGLGLLLLVVVILSGSGLYSTYTYRRMVKALSARVTGLPVAAQLSRHVGNLRITLSELHGLRAREFPNAETDEVPLRVRMVRDQFGEGLDEAEETLSRYRAHLEHKRTAGSRMADNQREWETVGKIEASLVRVHEANRDEDWMLDDVRIDQLDTELAILELLAAELPSHLHSRLAGFATEVRNQYRTLIVGTWLASISAALLLALSLKLVNGWVYRPLQELIAGSRKVAAGQFNHRIHLDGDDEMAELAGAMNDMTTRFQDIRDDLDRQVRQRTRQVVRSEQLASVGFLAAGVAHEINNPLASIALCAESLEGRVNEMASGSVIDGEVVDAHESQDDEDRAVIASYLKMIQSEAFRCKEITEKLLDFSRMGEHSRQRTELRELLGGVIEMVSHVSKHRGKNLLFVTGDPVVAPVNAQEIKQVVLNLLTNALDSIGDGGTVNVTLAERDGFAEMTFRDDGCGMSPEVLEHIFEPFFTRRKTGQGTGLGLSITYRIIDEHGGDILAESDGPGRGATFRVQL